MHSARVLENVGIFGVGGVGGYFGGKLCHCQREGKRLKVSFLARGAHLAAIRENGLLLKTEQEGALRCHPFLATDSMEDMPELDLCILCVKGFDLHALLVKLNDRIREDSIILPLLNGVDIHSRIRSVVKRGTVFPACVYVGTHIESHGVVSQKRAARAESFSDRIPGIPPPRLRNCWRSCASQTSSVIGESIFSPASGKNSSSSVRSVSPPPPTAKQSAKSWRTTPSGEPSWQSSMRPFPSRGDSACHCPSMLPKPPFRRVPNSPSKRRLPSTTMLSKRLVATRETCSLARSSTMPPSSGFPQPQRLKSSGRSRRSSRLFEPQAGPLPDLIRAAPWTLLTIRENQPGSTPVGGDRPMKRSILPTILAAFGLFSVSVSTSSLRRRPSADHRS